MRSWGHVTIWIIITAWMGYGLSKLGRKITGQDCDLSAMVVAIVITLIVTALIY